MPFTVSARKVRVANNDYFLNSYFEVSDGVPGLLSWLSTYVQLGP